MVCLGNICRSPLAEGILKHKIQQHQLNWQVDSAGLGHWHVGEKPDERAIYVANKKGIDITYQRARQFEKNDFKVFDKIYAMDLPVRNNLLSLTRYEGEIKKVDLILNELHPEKNMNVRDPYYDDDVKGFEEVFHLLDKACEEIIRKYQ